jgi:hypothetical protein
VKEADRLKGLLGTGVEQNLHVILEGHRLNPAWCIQIRLLHVDLKILLVSR